MTSFAETPPASDSAASIFLVRTTAAPEAVMAAGLADDLCELTEHLLVIDTPLSRSRLYHRLKALQPGDDPLLVTELAEPPKMRSMAPGSTAWLRDRLPATRSAPS